jgi:hypothetical protein
VLAENLDFAAGGHVEALEDLHRGGLPGAVGPEQPEALAGAHFEVQPVDGDDVGRVDLAQRAAGEAGGLIARRRYRGGGGQPLPAPQCMHYDEEVRTLQIRNLPDHLYEALALRAEREGRSLAQQAVHELGKLPEVEARARRRRRRSSSRATAATALVVSALAGRAGARGSGAVSARLVLDASAGLAAVAGGAEGRALLQPISEAEVVVAPDIYAAEVANGLWKYVGAGDLAVDEAQGRLLKALELVDLTLPSGELVSEALLEGKPPAPSGL